MLKLIKMANEKRSEGDIKSALSNYSYATTIGQELLYETYLSTQSSDVTTNDEVVTKGTNSLKIAHQFSIDRLSNNSNALSSPSASQANVSIGSDTFKYYTYLVD